MRGFLSVFAAAMISGAVSGAAYAAEPSFNCDKAGNPIERIICADDVLSSLDREMAELYGFAREILPEDQVAQQVDLQKRWLSDRNKWCALRPADEASSAKREAARDCLENTYRSRIDALSAAAPQSIDIWSVDVDAEGRAPEVCLYLSERAEPGDTPLSEWFRAEPETPLTATLRGRQVCLQGFEFGHDYSLTMLRGLRGDGAINRNDQTRTVEVPDRSPRIRVATTKRIMPRSGSAGLPVEAVNVKAMSARIYRISDAHILETLRRPDAGGEDPFQWGAPADITAKFDEVAFSGRIKIDAPKLNEPLAQALPIEKMVKDLAPGLYVAALTGEPLERERPVVEGEEGRWRPTVDPVFYWFSVSDMGLAAYRAADGLTVAARSTQGGAPVVGAEVTLYSAANAVLATATTDENGLAHIDAGYLRGEGPAAPYAAFAAGADGDFVSLIFNDSRIGLADRGDAGRAAPGALDAFVTTERGIYRPGDSVLATILLRGEDGAAADAPVTITLRRPDGAAAARRVLDSLQAGGALTTFDLPATAMTGGWRLIASVGEAAVGDAQILVEDFTPPRIEVSLKTDDAPLEIGGDFALEAQVDFLYGAPAAGLAGEAALTITAPGTPFKGYEGFVFNLLEDDRPTPVSAPAISFETAADGSASISAPIEEAPDSSWPLSVSAAVSAFDVGGRPVTQTATRLLHTRDAWLGLKAESDAPIGAEVAIEAAAVDAAGAAIAYPGAGWRVVRESVDYVWYQRGGRWDYEILRSDAGVVAEGALDIGVDGGAIAFMGESWGDHRVELTDAAGDVVASTRVYVGWRRPAPGEEPAPDRVAISLAAGAAVPGATIPVRIEPPFAGRVDVAVAGSAIYGLTSHDIPAGGASVDVTLPENADPAGVYLLVSAYGAADGVQTQAPRRAIGLVWVPFDAAPHSLSAAIDAPEVMRPGEAATITVSFAETGDEPVYAVLAAVDDGVLGLTGYVAPDPVAHVYGQRRLGAQLFDVYGRFIDAAGYAAGEIETGGDAMMAAMAMDSAQLSNLPTKVTKVAAWRSEIVAVKDGEATFDYTPPEFDGRLRLMAVAWSAKRLGSAQKTALSRRPFVAELLTPRFLAPGDEATATISLHNIDAPEGEYSAVLRAEGPVTIVGMDRAKAQLGAGGRSETLLTLIAAQDMGEARLTMTVADAAGATHDEVVNLSVRAGGGYETRRVVSELKPGEAMTADPSLIEGYYPQTARLDITANPLPDLDLPSIISGLSRYPYGCAEQTTSKALPLLYAGDLSKHYRMAALEGAEAGVDAAIKRLLGMQTGDGGFGLWQGSSSEPWLTAYVSDFLFEAKAKGFDAPDVALERAMTALTNIAENGSRGDDDALAGRAYAFSLLAAQGKADAARLRRFYAVRFAQLPNATAKAMIAAALAAVGDQERAKEAYARAVAAIPAASYSDYYSYGSRLREAAAVLAIGARAGLADAPAQRKQGQALAALIANDKWLSTQEQGWILRAGAQMLASSTAAMQLAYNDAPVKLAAGDTFFESVTDAATPPRLVNKGSAPIFSMISYGGVPRGAAAEENHGFAIERGVYDRSGAPVNLDAVKRNDLLVVVLKVTRSSSGAARAMIADFLPAGLEPENAALGGPAAEQFGWLPELSPVTHSELRDDRFLAAVDLANDKSGRSALVAYVARAVTPGRYRYDGAFVEDMYQPEDFGRSRPVEIVIQDGR